MFGDKEQGVCFWKMEELLFFPDINIKEAWNFETKKASIPM